MHQEIDQPSFEAPLKLREIRVLRTRWEMAGRITELALFNLAIYSKFRGCDLAQLTVACPLAAALLLAPW